ncbi:hypothetical protein R80B4_00940 [Fibrobacteres bacterium R8-0-B4]
MERNVKGLSDALFASLERLSDDSLKGAELVSEIDRADAKVRVVSQVNKTMDMMFKAARMLHETDAKNPRAQELLLEAVGKSGGGVAAIEKKGK